MDAISPQSLAWIGGEVPVLAGSPQGPNGADPREPPLRRMVRFVARWRWLLVAGVIAGLVLGTVMTLVTTRQYASSVRLEISRDTARVTKIDGVERETSIGDQEFYQTQYGLLKATGLAERVAGDLGYVDDARFFARFGHEAQFDQSRAIVSGEARQAKRREIAAEILLQHVTVAPVRGSSLVDITVTTPDPAMSQRVAAAWAKDFIQMTMERRFEASSYARQFLEKRIVALRGALETSERRAAEYARAQGIINLPQTRIDDGQSGMVDRSPLTDKLESMNRELAVATADRITAQSRIGATQRADANPLALDNVAISELRRERGEIAADFAKTSSEFGPDYPRVKALAEQLRDMDQSIAREVGRISLSLGQTYAAAAGRERTLASNVAGLKSQLEDLRQRSIQYGIYLRDADTNRELYNSLLQRYKEIGVAGSVEENNVAVINQPRLAERPVSPRLMVNLIFAMLAGGVLAIAAAAALSQIDQTISDPEMVRNKLGLPLLGTLPMVKGGAPLESLNDPRSPLVEGYLAVEASLRLATAHGVPRSIAFTSTRPREGKSTSAVALARLLAAGRKRVVLVDADMRAPSLHHAFDFPNDAGVSNLLSGGQELDRLVRATDQDGLSFIAAGPQPPNTARLLMGDGLRELIGRLLGEFDHVIVDSPPVMGLADAQLVAEAVEGVIFVVEAGATPTGAAQGALQRLREARAQFLGAIVTKLNTSRQPFAYDYGYGYGDRLADQT
jgi:capsular exopolysaccharide synthesis family protein